MLFTSAEEGGYVFGSVCLYVCLVMDIAVGCYAYGNMFWCM